MSVVKKFLFCWVVFSISKQYGSSQIHKAENLIVVVLDGMRWQGVFSGIGSGLINKPSFTKDNEGIARKFWDNVLHIRRKKLFPFLWETIGRQGQLYGNRLLGNPVNIKTLFSSIIPA